jgi:hypothetical protein
MPKRKRGGQPKDTEKWAVSVKLSTIKAFEKAAGKRARTLAARFLDDIAPAVVALALQGQPPGSKIRPKSDPPASDR